MKNLFFSLFAFLLIRSHAQNLMWAKNVSGLYTDQSKAIATDKDGNVIYGGYFTGGPVDFDPGPGVFNSGTFGAGFITKLDKYGNFIWLNQLNGNGDAVVYSITTDTLKNIYLTGTFSGTVDFNPGSGIFNLVSPGTTNNDIFISKIDANGNFIWVKQFTGSFFHDYSYCIKLDKYGNIYTTGAFKGNIDFDPGPGSYVLGSAGNDDVFISKLDPNGNFIYAGRIGGSSFETGASLDIDDRCNIVVTGIYYGSADFDPSISNYTMTPVGSGDVFVCKYDSARNFLWAKSFGGSQNDWGNSIAISKTGSIFFTGGYESSNADFDPSTSTYTLAAPIGSLTDVFVCKLNSQGNLLWVFSLNGSSYDKGTALTLDSLSNFYITGESTPGSLDLNPGTGIKIAVGKIFIAKMDSSSNFIWGESVNTGNNSSGTAIALDRTYNVSITGYYDTPGDFDPGPSTYTLNHNNTDDVFVLKFGCAPLVPTSILGSTFNCTGSTQTYSTNSIYGATSYNWILPSGWSGSSLSNSISVITGTNGVLTVAASNSCGISSPQSLSVTISPCTNIENYAGNTEGLKIYPNPATNKLIIKNSSESQLLSIEISNTLGQIIVKKNLEASDQEIFLNEIPAGIYIVTIHDIQKPIFKAKFVKQ